MLYRQTSNSTKNVTNIYFVMINKIWMFSSKKLKKITEKLQKYLNSFNHHKNHQNLQI